MAEALKEPYIFKINTGMDIFNIFVSDALLLSSAFALKLIIMEINEKMLLLIHNALWVKGRPLLWCVAGKGGSGCEAAEESLSANVAG